MKKKNNILKNATLPIFLASVKVPEGSSGYVIPVEVGPRVTILGMISAILVMIGILICVYQIVDKIQNKSINKENKKENSETKGGDINEEK